MRVLGHIRVTGEIFGGPLLKASQVRKSGEIVLVFDGLAEHDYNAYRISTRHGRSQSKCNMLFADGHCETVDISSLPNGATQATSDLRGAQYLKKYAHPKWRLDQP
jgi:prepilin-type processing-associated H-X9-DG protein